MEHMERLLTAKIRPPQIGIETLWRKRLLDNFDGYKNKRLTVVSAPTGYGKTILISQFATQVNNPVVWYQLDATGITSDVERFKSNDKRS